jgi:hypothetical protein
VCITESVMWAKQRQWVLWISERWGVLSRGHTSTPSSLCVCVGGAVPRGHTTLPDLWVLYYTGLLPKNLVKLSLNLRIHKMGIIPWPFGIQKRSLQRLSECLWTELWTSSLGTFAMCQELGQGLMPVSYFILIKMLWNHHFTHWGVTLYRN